MKGGGGGDGGEAHYTCIYIFYILVVVNDSQG